MKKTLVTTFTAFALFAGGTTAGACYQPVSKPPVTVTETNPVDVPAKTPVPEQDVSETKTVEQQVTTPVGTQAQQVLEYTNAARAQQGLPALKLDTRVTSTAQTKALDMATNRYFSHTSPTLGSPFDQMKKEGISYRRAAENIAMGQRSAKEVVDAWMASPGHRANILDRNLTHIGIGYSSKGNYWVQQFVSY